MIISKTPYRLSFFGGGTDYKPWFEEHGGCVIAVALARYCYLTVRHLPPFFPDYSGRVIYSRIEAFREFDDIEHPSARNCLKYLKIDPKVEIHHVGDLPARSGIGSSSSFTVGLLNALYGLKEKMVKPKKLAEEAIHVEQNLIGESVGVQDQIMAAHGGFRWLEFGKGNVWSTRNVILPKDYVRRLSEHVLLGFSGISRTAEKHAGKQVENIKKGKNVEHLQGIKALAEEALKAFCEQADWDRIGGLLDESWKRKRRLSEGVSADWMDDLYETAIRNGAFGGKLMGAGGGGFFFFLAPPEKHARIKKALSEIKVWVPFQIDYEGSQIIFYRH